jgi:flavin reductase (DIM6/NTAB) family NADH-FMN oxidoreductase RutF
MTLTFSAGDFRKALGTFPTGVAIITARGLDGALHGMTVSSFNSVSLDPPLVLFSVARTVQSFAVWEQAKEWGINILAEAQDALSTRFAKSGPGKWSGIEPIFSSNGVPLLPEVLAHFECERYAIYEGGDHLIMVGKVLSLGQPSGSVTAPLVFFSGRYHQLDRPRPGASEDDERLLFGWSPAM